MRPDSSARTSRYAAPTNSSTSSASGLLTRPIATVTGVMASAAAASTPAGGPNSRRTVANSSATAAIVNSACGSRSESEEKPNTRADRPMQPQRERRLVHGDEAAGIERAEEPGLPALAAGLRGGGVVRVRVAGRVRSQRHSAAAAASTASSAGRTQAGSAVRAADGRGRGAGSGDRWSCEALRWGRGRRARARAVGGGAGRAPGEDPASQRDGSA